MQGVDGVTRSVASLKWFQGILSTWILFHVFAVLLIPNAQNFIGTQVAPWIEPYANFFEFTNIWSFFAPEPGPPPVFIEYELINRHGESFKRGHWPSERDPFRIRERQNRRIAAAEFMMSSEVRTERMMVQYLCRSYEGTGSVRLWRVVYSIPEFREVAEGKRRIGDDAQMERKLAAHSFCGGA